jgi:hypothetical protein
MTTDNPGGGKQKKRGGSSKRQRTKLTAHRWLDEEFNVAAERADAAGLSFAAYIRAAALGNPGPRARRRPPADQKDLRRILGQCGRIGGNIHQIARRLNAGERASLPELQEALRAYLDLRAAIFQALGMTTDPPPP